VASEAVAREPYPHAAPDLLPRRPLAAGAVALRSRAILHRRGCPRAYLRDLPQAELQLLPEAGHFALETHGAEIAALMLDFLARHLPPNAQSKCGRLRSTRMLRLR
jgi:pimeloyl-ACP methyl ester carboxylesterase